MYKVMLVDDDYPVLEFLSEMINWEGLGLTLQSVHVNGLSALVEAEKNMPDILITDIGMPKLNGIELIKNLKEKSPSLLVAILSCHSEFDYAQQALKLNVQEYIVKDMLDLEHIVKLLRQFKHKLDSEKEKKKNQLQLAHTIERNKGIILEKFINKTIFQPIFEDKVWYEEAKLLGLVPKQKYIIILCVADHYQSILKQFHSKDMLNFLFHNVITEVFEHEKINGEYGHFEKKESFLFISINNEREEDMRRIKGFIQKLQLTLQDTFGISMSFIIGNAVIKPLAIKKQMVKLIESNVQKFYLKQKSIGSSLELVVSEKNIFSWYDEASSEFKEIILLNSLEQKTVIIKKWIHFIISHQFSPESVKDWMLKILLDIKVKLQALSNFDLNESNENLHETISRINGIYELEDWLIDYFNDIKYSSSQSGSNNEIANACRYILNNIHRKITLDEVARYLHLNSSYFSRLFKKEVGENFVKYVVNIKMQRAKELLEQTNFTILEISEQIGYENQGYFNKSFKLTVGVAPFEYRCGIQKNILTGKTGKPLTSGNRT